MKAVKISELVVRARMHDSEAFTMLMQYFAKDMYRTAIAILMNDEDAADAIQDTILTCWEKMDTIREPGYFKTWMIRVLINKCYDIRNQRVDRVDMEAYDKLAIGESSLDNSLNELLSQLEERYRLPMMLYYGEGYKTPEIAQLLNIPKSTVQTRLARGREKLGAYYGKGRK